MTTTTSFSNNRFMSMFKASLLRTKSLTIFYTIIIFVFFPLQYIMTITSGNAYYVYNDFAGMSRLYTMVSVFFFTGIMMCMPLFLGAQLFGDMHSKKSVDLYHSLPIKRSTSLCAKMAAGMTSMGFVLIVNYAITMIAQQFYFGQLRKQIPLLPTATDGPYMLSRINEVLGMNNVIYALGDILCWFAVLFTLLAIMAFVCVQVGTIFDTTVMTLGTYGVLPVVYLVFIGLCEQFIYGYEASINLSVITNLSPISSMVQRLFMDNYEFAEAVLDNSMRNYYQIANIAIVIWTIVGAALLFMAVKIYEKRKSEQAESTDTHGILKIFLKLAGTFVAAVAVGMIFQAMFGNITYMYLGVVIGAILFYITIDIIFARSFKRVIRSMPGGAICGAVVALMIVFLSNGAFGYATSTPNMDDIQNVTINYRGPYGSYNEYIDYSITEGYYGTYMSSVTLESKEAIEIILNTHKTQVTLHKNKQYEQEARYDSKDYGNLRVNYTLKNGKTVTRVYNNLYNDATKIYSTINTNEEFVRKTHPAFRTTYDMTKGSITIYNTIGAGNTIKLNREQFDGLMTAISNDMLSRTHEDLVNPQSMPLGYIEMNYIDNDYINENSGNVVQNGNTAQLDKQAQFRDGYFIIDKTSAYTINYLEKIGYAVTALATDMNDIEGLVITMYPYGKNTFGTIYQVNFEGVTFSDISYYRQIEKDRQEQEADQYFNSETFTEDRSEIEAIMKNTRATGSVISEDLVFVSILPSSRLSDDSNAYANLTYVIKRSDLPENIAKKLPTLDTYYLDRYGNRDYIRNVSAIGIIGGADGPTAIYATSIYATSDKTADTATEEVAEPVLQLQPEPVTEIAIAKAK